MQRPPYPGFPKYPPGDPRNAEWLARLHAYNARIEESNRRLLLGIRNVVSLMLLACLFAIWELLR